MKFLNIIIFIICSTLSSYAIKNYGFKSGITLSRWDVNFVQNVVDKEFLYLPGFTGGVFLEWLEEPYLTILSEFNYLQKGSRYKVLSEGENFWGEPDYDYINRLHYLSLPILVKYKATQNNYVPYLLIGFRYDYLISSSIESAEFKTKYDNFQNHNLGADFGLGFDFSLFERDFNLEYRFSSHFNYLFKTNSDGLLSFDIKNESHKLTLGFLFKKENFITLTDSKKQENSLAEILEAYSQKDSELSDYLKKQVKTERNKTKVAPQENNLSKALFYSSLLPGFGQYNSGRKVAGLSYGALNAVALIYLTTSYLLYDQKVNDWNEAVYDIAEASWMEVEAKTKKANQLKDEALDLKDNLYFSLGLAGVAYLLNIGDVLLFTENEELKTSYNPGKQELKLSYNFKFKGSK